MQAYIAAMPGWKREVGRRLDALIARTVPGVAKAVKWNSPFYGVEEGVWFLSFHCFAKYVKVAFFRGASLRPVPPGQSKQKDVRYLDIHEDDEFDEAQLAAWVKQASQVAGRAHVSGSCGRAMSGRSSLDELKQKTKSIVTRRNSFRRKRRGHDADFTPPASHVSNGRCSRSHLGSVRWPNRLTQSLAMIRP